jgi:hypothetical protein
MQTALAERPKDAFHAPGDRVSHPQKSILPAREPSSELVHILKSIEVPTCSVDVHCESQFQSNEISSQSSSTTKAADLISAKTSGTLEKICVS